MSLNKRAVIHFMVWKSANGLFLFGVNSYFNYLTGPKQADTVNCDLHTPPPQPYTDTLAKLKFNYLWIWTTALEKTIG